MSTTPSKMLAEHDPSQTLLQQIVGGLLAIIAALGTWVAKLKGEKGVSESRVHEIIRQDVRKIIQEELNARQFGRP